MSVSLQTIKYDQRTQSFPFGLIVKLSNIVAPTPAVYDFPDYVVLAIGQGEVGLTQVNGKAIVNTGGKNRITGDIDYIIYVRNPPVITQAEYEYAVQNRIYDVIAGYLHQHTSPGNALYNYYQLFMNQGIAISDEFFDNFNDLFYFLRGAPITSLTQAMRIARAIIFLCYFYPDLASIILQPLNLPACTGVYYEDFLAVLNVLTSIFPLAPLLRELLQAVSTVLGIGLSNVSQLLSELLDYAQSVLQQLQEGVEITAVTGLHLLKRKAIETLLVQPLSLIYSLITGYPIITPIYSLIYPLLRLITAIDEALLYSEPSAQLNIIESSVPTVPVTSTLENVLQEVIELVSAILGVATSTITSTVSSVVSEVTTGTSTSTTTSSSVGIQFPLINTSVSILSGNTVSGGNITIGGSNTYSIGNNSPLFSSNTIGSGNTYSPSNVIGSYNSQSNVFQPFNNAITYYPFSNYYIPITYNNASSRQLNILSQLQGTNLFEILLNGNPNSISAEISTSTSAPGSTSYYVYKRKYCIVPGVCF